ncbi:MAG TPA: hypothetical protein VNO54_16785 [Streptosporangiaceae bacterium]|nr:hypothetical protein [Streptosporangiaceae bacterium]
MLSFVRCRFTLGFHRANVKPLSVNTRPFINDSGDRFGLARSRLSSRRGAAPREMIAFAARNDLGVLDHYLTLNSGEVIYVPMRVIADESGSEVVFTVRRRPGMTDDEFKADGDAVAADLARLKRVLEQ